MGILSMFSPAQWLGGLKWAAILAIVSFGMKIGNDFLTDARNQRNALIEANAEKVSAQARNQELSNANTLLEDAIRITQESVRASSEAITELKKQNAEAQAAAAAQKSVLTDVERLQTLANARTSLIEKMVNRATKERFDELEAIFNES